MPRPGEPALVSLPPSANDTRTTHAPHLPRKPAPAGTRAWNDGYGAARKRAARTDGGRPSPCTAPGHHLGNRRGTVDHHRLVAPVRGRRETPCLLPREPLVHGQDGPVRADRCTRDFADDHPDTCPLGTAPAP